MLMARPGRHQVKHMACANQHSFLHGEDESASVAKTAASMAAQFEQHRENKTRTLAQSKEPALRCFPGAAQAQAAAAWDANAGGPLHLVALQRTRATGTENGKHIRSNNLCA